MPLKSRSKKARSKSRPRVLIIFDTAGTSSEYQDFSREFKTDDWATEAHIVAAVKKLGFPHTLLGIHSTTGTILKKVREFKPQILFNLVESFQGQLHGDQKIAAFFTRLKIPFTGCGPEALTLCKNKALSKKILRDHQIPVPKFWVFQENKKRIPQGLTFPLIVKPLKGDASYGISRKSLVKNSAELRKRISMLHRTMKQAVIAEEYIEGRELYVSLLGNEHPEILPVREMIFSKKKGGLPIATYRSKWSEPYRRRHGIKNTFASLLPSTESRIKTLSRKIYRHLKITGYARLDLRLAPDGKIYFLEANPNPILAKWEDFAQSALKGGLSYPSLIEKIIRLSRLHD